MTEKASPGPTRMIHANSKSGELNVMMDLTERQKDARYWAIAIIGFMMHGVATAVILYHFDTGHWPSLAVLCTVPCVGGLYFGVRALVDLYVHVKPRGVVKTLTTAVAAAVVVSVVGVTSQRTTAHLLDEMELPTTALERG